MQNLRPERDRRLERGEGFSMMGGTRNKREQGHSSEYLNNLLVDWDRSLTVRDPVLRAKLVRRFRKRFGQ